MKLFHVDAFAEEPFTGNPAGVCVLDEPKPESWMLLVAREMNLSETAFLARKGTGYDLRWFTPTTEVSLCGHATLASAHVIWQERLIANTETIVFMTKSGELRARRDANNIELDFPSRQVQQVPHQDELNQALRITPIFTGKYSLPNGDLYLLEMDSDRGVKAIAPNYQQLLSSGARAVIVTSPSSDSRYDFVSRFFAPAVGINEDPVTGSAHCYLTPYWGSRLGKNEMTGYQASERTGIVTCKWAGDRVSLGGKAVTIFRAELLV
jgi:PhzF family phenazine biosynthesis protein